MIEIGYTKLVDGEPVDVIDSNVTTGMPDANAALAALQTTIASRTDVTTLFMQRYNGTEDEKIAFLDPA